MAVKPFTAEFVLGVTFKQIHAACDKSIERTKGQLACSVEDKEEVEELLVKLTEIKAAVVAVEKEIRT